MICARLIGKFEVYLQMSMALEYLVNLTNMLGIVGAFWFAGIKLLNLG